MDRFAFIVVDLSLAALIDKGDLYKRFNQGGKAIIFCAKDFADPENSAIFHHLFRWPSLRQLALQLAVVCQADVSEVPSLSDFLAGRNLPVGHVDLSGATKPPPRPKAPPRQRKPPLTEAPRPPPATPSNLRVEEPQPTPETAAEREPPVELGIESLSPPRVPEQGVGLKFTIAKTGLIDSVAENKSEPRYDKALITALLPQVASAVRDLTSVFEAGEGHNAFAEILADAQEYLEAISRPAHEISFNEVWVLGVHLQKTADAAERDIENRIRPELEDNQKKALDTVLAIHGPFILATEDGQQLFDAAQRYSRSQEEGEKFRELAEALNQAVHESKNLATDKVKHQLELSNKSVGTGKYIEREQITSETSTRNFLATVGTVALFAGTAAAGSIVSGVVAETEAGMSIIEFGSRNLDKAIVLARIACQFLLENETILRGLAASCSESLSWLTHLMNWLKRNYSTQF